MEGSALLANQHSTCEWVDFDYACRLWRQLLSQRFPCRDTLWKLQLRGGAQVREQRELGKRFFVAHCFAAGPGQSLDLLVMQYNAGGQRLREHTFLRITQHAGRRMFERLRTNSAEDLQRTATEALAALLKDSALWPTSVEQGAETTLPLPWGRFHLVCDAGCWIGKTFIAGGTL